ncbi:MAG: amino acid ABC transporter permease [Armatimonadota bacterium]
MSFSFLTREIQFLLHGLLVSAGLTVGALAIGTVLAAGLAMLRLGSNKVAARAATAYVEFMRGTPLLVQLFIIYFGLSPFFARVTGVEMTPLIAGILGLGLNAGAYISEIFRGAMQSIPAGQMEAARSLGMSSALAMRRIVWPQALRHAVPALGSSFAALIKDTSLVMVIGVPELLLSTKQRVSATYEPMQLYLLAGVLYFGLTLLVTYAVRWWEGLYKWKV